jgi:hypothetical protein
MSVPLCATQMGDLGGYRLAERDDRVSHHPIGKARRLRAVRIILNNSTERLP